MIKSEFLLPSQLPVHVHLSYPTVFFTWSDVQLSEEGVEGRGLSDETSCSRGGQDKDEDLRSSFGLLVKGTMFSSKNGYLTNQCLTMLLAEDEQELSLFARLFRFDCY